MKTATEPTEDVDALARSDMRHYVCSACDEARGGQVFSLCGLPKPDDIKVVDHTGAVECLVCIDLAQTHLRQHERK